MQLLLAGQRRGLLAEGLPRWAWLRLQLAVALLLQPLRLLMLPPWNEVALLMAEHLAWHQAPLQLLTPAAAWAALVLPLVMRLLVEGAWAGRLLLPLGGAPLPQQLVQQRGEAPGQSQMAWR